MLIRMTEGFTCGEAKTFWLSLYVLPLLYKDVLQEIIKGLFWGGAVV